MLIKNVLVYVAIALIGAAVGRYSVAIWPTKVAANSLSPAPIPNAQSKSGNSVTNTLVNPVFKSEAPASVNYLKVGDVGSDGGLKFEFVGFAETTSIPGRRGTPITAKQDAKFVAVRIKFKNEGMESADIRCDFHMGSKLYDKDGRQFDHISRLYDIEGNTRCNDNIQPGFGSSEVIAFELPTAFVPDDVKFWDPREKIGDDKDSFGERTAVRFRLTN